MTTQTAWPVSLEGSASQAEAVAAVPAPWRTSSVVLLLLVVADATLTAVLVGGQTWWLAMATWAVGLLLVLRTVRPRLV